MSKKKNRKNSAEEVSEELKTPEEILIYRRDTKKKNKRKRA